VRSNVLAGTNPDRIVECVKSMLGKDNSWENPFGDGNAARKIIGILSGSMDKSGEVSL